MTEILMSIKPRFADAILSGKKSIELRRKIGTLFLPQNRIIIYSSSPTMATVGEATIQEIIRGKPLDMKDFFLENAMVNDSEFTEYFYGCTTAFGIALKDVITYKKQIPLSAMRSINITPPQSYCYINEENIKALGI